MCCDATYHKMVTGWRAGFIQIQQVHGIHKEE